MNNASVNTHVQVSVWMYVFISRGCVAMSRIARSSDNFMFNNLGEKKKLGELVDCFPKQLHHFNVPQAVGKSSNFSTPSPLLVIIYLFG